MSLEAILTSPHVIDALLGLVVIEGAGLALWGRRIGRSCHQPDAATADNPVRHRRKLGARDTILLLLPGVCLMLAIRAALTGTPWPWVPMALAASGVAHLADLWNRRSSP